MLSIIIWFASEVVAVLKIIWVGKEDGEMNSADFFTKSLTAEWQWNLYLNIMV
jgi:hypothetical protein